MENREDVEEGTALCTEFLVLGSGFYRFSELGFQFSFMILMCCLARSRESSPSGDPTVGAPDR